MSPISKLGRERVHVSGFDVEYIVEGKGMPLLFLHAGEGRIFRPMPISINCPNIFE
jgi:hypothetical protein